MALRSHSISQKNILRTPIPWIALLFFALLFPHFKTAYVDTFDSADLLFNVARVISLFVTVALYVVKGHRADSRVGFLIAFEFCLLLSTLLQGGAVIPFVSSYVLGLGVYLLVDLYSSKPRMIVGILFFVGEVLVYANLISMIVAPDGLYVSKLLGYYHNWILGYKNQFLPFFICFATASFLKMRYSRKHLRPIALLAAMLFSLILGKSSTSLIVMVIFVIGMVMAETRMRLIFNPYLLAVIVVAVFFVVVLLSSSETISGFIAAVANRDVTFSGRTLIWSSVMDAIVQRPLLGWGVMPDADHITLLGHPEASSAHNFYLEVLLSGGFLALFVYGAFVVLVLKRLKSHEGSYASKLFAVALFALGIAYMTEAYSNPIIFVLFALASNVEKYAYAEKERPLALLPDAKASLSAQLPATN